MTAKDCILHMIHLIPGSRLNFIKKLNSVKIVLNCQNSFRGNRKKVSSDKTGFK